MEIVNNCIYFKSNPDMYLKELYGKKPNTVRVFNDTEWVNFQNAIKKLTHIRITNNDTGETFKRELTDISNHGFEFRGIEDLTIWIFSWKNYKLIDEFDMC